MLRSLYSGVSGMRGFQTKLDVIGNNIANVNTVGFKKSRVMFQDILSQNMAGATGPIEEEVGGLNPKQIGLGSSIASIDVVHSAGSPMTTYLTSDLAIEGDGFFVVNPGGDVETNYLTRNGSFTRDALGQLVTSQGMFVLDAGGEPITIPREDYVSYSIGKNGVITGTTADGVTEEIATIGVVTVSNPGGLKKIGNSLYEVTVNAIEDGEYEIVTPTEANSAIVSGVLEMSNVDLSEEFTEMIVAQRGFQANSRIITTSDTILEELINLKR
ncbi:flagellar basal-body rod protein FlgF [Brevibacillus humidisoli]|uniref:flagellar basal-body rod protein FlgF n=1 Tax=Brevibacillus humidisoli TaxID=2895522 RepID=UPI001E4B05B2|nr:flagellar basal-body rod protein FlgF [Brevibacillus humidisoli]UFJ42132.1 flagellar basal-body rod protein FlgF [Brevibacillus humidisoli]